MTIVKVKPENIKVRIGFTGVSDPVVELDCTVQPGHPIEFVKTIVVLNDDDSFLERVRAKVKALWS